MRISYGIILFPVLGYLGGFSDSNKVEGRSATLVTRAKGASEHRFVPQTTGPSGVLKKPKGGSIYTNHVGNVGNVEVLYLGVSDGSNEFGARTCTIDLHLVPKSEKRFYEQAFNVTSPSAINDTVIHFQSAAPLITFTCVKKAQTTIVIDNAV
ncbi:hypothetical protein CROQUDRAFT_650483 [Cronartium quercuum f. sp. fusiforme G11]|uniref:Uncharacterized protein n=1 Tax=Cronartium quercuum f. sp. fusiforme G11 TaxID=708437 RepID=A0A9P6NR91_9BASI|nr:hypothetical protein CROQUDRAFT_650483 [Cronartium quercuum f. sp. fusiforme G11]